MTNQDNTLHYRTDAYERPSFPYVCGRACAFGKPCPKGPSFRGACGGTRECTPFRNGDRWQCRRPASVGGACEEGPLPDGTCCKQHPPCKPELSLRKKRFRASLLVGLFVIASIFAFMQFRTEAFRTDLAQASSMMPGPLSGAHSNFVLAEQGCTACHKAHGEGIGGWTKAFFSGQDMSGNCSGCHAFGGPQNSPHNSLFQSAAFKPDSPSADVTTDCVMCHTEHKGQLADIATMQDAQCNSCHETQIASFGAEHPEFGAKYPHNGRGAINFDHVSHFAAHFEKKNAADTTCVTCHEVERAGLDVPVGSFEDNCASCHAGAISDRPLYLMTLPWMEEDPFDADEVAELCGPTPEQVEYLQARAEGDEDAEEHEFYEYFFDDEGDNLSAFMALAMGVPNDDPDSYIDAVVEMKAALAESGAEPLIEGLMGLSGAPNADQMLSGLPGELLKQVACAWMQKVEHEAPSEMVGGGWHSDGLSVTYRPSGHADPVAKAWFDFAVDAPRAAEAAGADDEEIERLEVLRDELLADSGFGNCTKCHAVTEITDEMPAEGENSTRLIVEWGFQPKDDRAYVKYDHGPHINLLGPGTLCTNCHEFNPQAEYQAGFKHLDPPAFEAGFKPVGKTTCLECHTEGKVRNDCLLCHEYHLEPKFKESMMDARHHSTASTGDEGG